MKATLEFELPEEREEFKMAQNAASAHIAFEEIWEKLFRPRNKHGFQDEELQLLAETEIGEKIFDKLEELYHKIRDENDL